MPFASATNLIFSPFLDIATAWMHGYQKVESMAKDCENIHKFQTFDVAINNFKKYHKLS